ncbi:MAG: hypothetical protein M5U26_02565 [Planctomycetota bacterium]|nr:hypothetical protein [Planctomycetota bacterium]
MSLKMETKATACPKPAASASAPRGHRLERADAVDAAGLREARLLSAAAASLAGALAGLVGVAVYARNWLASLGPDGGMAFGAILFMTLNFGTVFSFWAAVRVAHVRDRARSRRFRTAWMAWLILQGLAGAVLLNLAF